MHCGFHFPRRFLIYTFTVIIRSSIQKSIFFISNEYGKHLAEYITEQIKAETGYMYKFILILILLCAVSATEIFSQEEQPFRKPDYLSFQSGLVLDSYASVGIRTYFEFQKEIATNRSYGISFENTRHYGTLPDIRDALATNLNLLSFNGYYRLNLIKDKAFWNAGAGIGIVHVFFDDTDKLGYVFNASLTLNIKLSKRIYFETSPLFILLPTSRVYYSPMNLQRYNDFFALSFLSFGIKTKL